MSNDKKYTEEQFRQLIQKGVDLIAILTSEGVYKYVSPTFKSILGYEPKDLIGVNAFDLVYPGDKKPLYEQFMAYQNNKKATSSPYRFRKKDGSYIWLQSFGTNLLDDPSVEGIVVNSVDVTESHYYNRLDKLERKILEKNVAAEDLHEILKTYTEGIEDIHPGMLCSIQKVEGNQLFNLVSSNLPKTYLEAIEGLKIGKNQGACGTAAYLGEKVIISDAENDERTSKFLDLVENYQFKSLWSYPVKDENQNVIAIFAAYYHEPREPGGYEENTIERAAKLTQVILKNQRTLQALNMSNERFKYINLATEEVIYDHDLEGDEIKLSDNFEKIFGYTFADEEFTLEKWATNIHPDDREKINRRLENTLKDKGINKWDAEFRYARKDGTYAHVVENSYILRDKSGKAVRMIGAIRDETVRIREEERLKLLESVVTHSNDAVLITKAEPLDSPDGPEIVYANKAFEKMTGYSSKELIGNTPRILHGPNTDYEALKKFGEKIRRWETAEVETINYKKNGEEFWIHFSVSPVADEKGWYTHWISIERDVTERKNREIKQKLISNISRIFNETGGVRKALKKALLELKSLGKFRLAEIWLTNHSGKSIDLAASLDKEVERFYNAVDGVVSFKPGKGLPGKTWKTGETQLWKNIDKRKSFKRREAAETAGLKTAWGIPIPYEDKVIGVLLLAVAEDVNKAPYYKPILEEIASYLGDEIHRKELEQELSRIFSSAPDIICIAGFDGYFRKVNPEMSELLGYSEQELLTTPIVDFTHPEDRKKTEGELDALNKGEGKHYFENRYITKTGNVVWLSWTTKIFYEEGITFSVAKDVTEKKELESLLDQTNRLARIGSWEYDLVEDKIYWSEMIREIHEVGPEFEPDFEVAMRFYNDEDRQKLNEAVQKAIDNGTSWDLELKINTPKGIERWVRSIGETEEVDGKCVRIYGSFQDIDQRKKAEIALQNAFEEKNEILESIGDAFFALDKSWTVTYWNHMAEEVLGMPREKILGENLWDLYEDATSLEFYTQYHKAVNEQVTVHFEEYYPTLEKWFEVSAYPSSSGLSVYFQDITDRKKNREKLLEKTRQLDAIAMFNGQLIKKDHWIEALDECLGVFGEVAGADRVYYFENEMGNSEEVSTTSMKIEWTRERIQPEIDNPAHQNLPLNEIRYFADILSDKKAFNQIVNEIPDKGFKKFLREQNIQSLLAMPVFTNNRFRGFIGFDDCTGERIWRDEEIKFLQTISINLASAIENEDAEEALQKAYDEKNDILESIGDGFFAVDNNFIVTYWNNKAEELVYIPKKKILSNNFWEIFDDATEMESYRQYNKALNEQVAVNFEDYYEKVGKWFEANAYPSSNGLSVFFKDITDRKESEKRLRELNRSLEERTKELAASNAELEQFAFVASHDLQEPLRMITGFLSQLEKKYDSVLDEKGRKYVHFATDGAKRMREIILDLLEFSRVGRVDSEKETVDMNDLLQDVLSLNKRMIVDSKAKIEIDDLPVITAASGAMRQLFQNLVNNAIKYQKKDNQPIVKISCSEDDNYWHFRIRDNGIGINPEYTEKIFTLFQRLHGREEYSGSGVGLAICKKIVTDHGGDIWVESEEGKGSTFHFTIAKHPHKE